MTKRSATINLAWLLALTLVFNVTSFAGSTPERDARLAEKVKTGIAKLGAGPSTRVTIKLRDKTEITGYISEMSDSGFVVTGLNGAEPATVAYSNVVQLRATTSRREPRWPLASGSSRE